MGIRFLGLIGPLGVLPHTYTEHAAVAHAREGHGVSRFSRTSSTIARFRCSIAPGNATVPPSPLSEGRKTGSVRTLLDLVGAGTSEVQKHSTVSVETLAHYASLLSLSTRPAEGLARLVADYFGVDGDR
jgi:type VI secretion system protein ImpH